MIAFPYVSTMIQSLMRGFVPTKLVATNTNVILFMTTDSPRFSRLSIFLNARILVQLHIRSIERFSSSFNAKEKVDHQSYHS